MCRAHFCGVQALTIGAFCDRIVVNILTIHRKRCFVMKNTTLIARLVAIVLCFLSLQYGIARAEGDLPFDGCVTADQVSVYQDSNAQSKRLTRLDSDTFVSVIGVKQYGDRIWYEILFEDNRRGYIDAKYVERQIVTLAYNTLLELDDLRLGTSEVGAILGVGTAIDVPKNGTATVIYFGVGTYSGNFSDGERSGEGTFVWDTGEYYTGQWYGDGISGKGTLVFADGTTYSGTFRRGTLYTGTMEIVQQNGNVLTRKIQEGTIQRKATLVCKNGTIVEGQMDSKGFYGQTTIKYSNGDAYVGALSEGLKSGEGTYTWANGAHYVGYWKKDMMNGTGTYYFTKNQKNNYIRGQFTNNNPSSTITYVSTQGIYYDTTWKNGKCTKITVQKK